MKFSKLAIAIFGALSLSSAQAFDVSFTTESSETFITINWSESFDNAVTLHYGNSPDAISSGKSVTVEQGANSVTLNHLDYDLTYYFKLSQQVDGELVFSNQTGVGFVPAFAYDVIEVVESPVEGIIAKADNQAMVSNDGRYVYQELEVDASIIDTTFRDQYFVYDRKRRKSSAISYDNDTVFSSTAYFIVDVDNEGNGYFSTRNFNLTDEPDQLNFRTLYKYSPETESVSLLLKEESGRRLQGAVELFDVSSDGNTIAFVIDDVESLPGYADFEASFRGDHAFTYNVVTDTFSHISNFDNIANIGTIDIVKVSPNGRYVALRTNEDDILQTVVPSDTAYSARYMPVLLDSQTGERRIPTLEFLADGSTSADSVLTFEVLDNGDMLIARNDSKLYKYSWQDESITLLSSRDELEHRIQSYLGHRMDASDDGNLITFATSRDNFDPRAPSAQVQVFNVSEDSTATVSLNSAQEFAISEAEAPSISNNGQYVTFNSFASNLVSEKKEGFGYFVTFADRTDSDGDGVVNTIDQAPHDANDWLDTDGDGIANYLETDSDNDGVTNSQESEWGLNPINAADGTHDVDGDTLSAAQEAELGTSIFLVDTDSDTYNDNEDAFPTDSTEWLDTDSDGIGNNTDEDDDNDGFNDDQDIFPLDNTEWLDTDEDGIGNNADTDDDNDGVADGDDAFPLDATESVDTDEDGIGNNADTDDDNDGVLDEEDDFPLDASETTDTDGDGIGDNSDPDIDGDSIANLIDCSPNDSADAKRCQKIQFDYDGDGTADIAVRRPSTFLHYISNTDDQEIQRITLGQNRHDIPVSGDFDGDGITDIAVRRPSTQIWYIANSSGVDPINGADDGVTRIRFGFRSEDIPVPADYDGDGITDIAVRRPSTQLWYVRNSSGVDPVSGNSDGITRLRFGFNPTDIPVVADYDGDGKADFAVRRPSTSFWYIRNSAGKDLITGFEDGTTRKTFGSQATDVPVPADYDGDGLADIAFRRPSNQTWYVLNSSGTNFNSSREDGIQRVVFGAEDDIAIPADYDGDRVTDFAVRTASTQTQQVLRSSDSETYTITFGRQAADIPLAAGVTVRMEMAASEDD